MTTLKACFAAYAVIHYASVYNQKQTEKWNPDNCSQNVIRLMERFEKAGKPLDIKQAKVLYLWQPGENLYARDARGGGGEWKFHVVLEYQGRILDLDHGDEPRDVTPAQYFEQMFLRGSWLREELLAQMKVRAVPAVDYRRDLNTMVGGKFRGYGFYLSDPDAEKSYPSKPLEDYLLDY
jgi:hypothetical protein